MQQIFTKNNDNSYSIDDTTLSWLKFDPKLDGAILEYSDIDNIKKVKDARQNLGIIAKNHRHDIMLAAELEPDFMVLNVWQDGIEKTQELITWYNEFFLIQLCLILNDKTLKPEDFDAELIISCC